MKESRKLRLIQAQKLVIFVSIVAMLSGLLFSRFLLSAGLVVFATTCLIHRDLVNQLKTFFCSPLLWATSLLFLMPLISGLWSEDVSQWSQIVRIKLPLLILPICFVRLNYFSWQEWRRVAIAFLLVVTLGVCWSLWQYFHDIDSAQAAYLQAQTIETPLGNDHVRFSLLVAIASLASTFLLTTNNDFKRPAIIALVAITSLLAIYLHVLAVRTGLICFYIGVIVFVGWLFASGSNKGRYLWLALLLLVIPFGSWLVLPTLKNRVNYLRYDLSFVTRGEYRNGSNDGNRLLSIRAGWQLQNRNPLFGVGFGDIRKETDRVYDKQYPQMTMQDRILPSSEWAMYGAGAGWPGFTLFSVIMIIPFLVRQHQKNLAWCLLNIFMAVSYLFDIGLEVQYGVFLHAFILLWWYKWLQTMPAKQTKLRKRFSALLATKTFQ